MVLAVLENTLPSFRWSYKLQDKEATVTVLTALALLAVVAVSVMTATPLKLNPLSVILTLVSGLQKGPAERGHIKKRQKSSKSVKKFFDTFRQFSRRAKNVKNRQKASKSFSTLFDNFRAAPFYRPLLGGSDLAEFPTKKGLGGVARLKFSASRL